MSSGESQFSDLERAAALWNYSLFFWGEDAVTDGLSPYIDAAPLEEQKYFLATQQVDEARHAVFFKRFMEEVVGIGGSTGDALAAIKPQLTWGFMQVFDRLERMSDELRQDRSIPKLAQAITLYHVVIEATLAQPGQHFITSYLEDRKLLPGFREGMENVAQDEQRHIGFGVKMLSDLRKMDPEVPGGRGRPAARGDPVDRLRADPAELGRALHRVLRLHDGGHRRGGRHLARDQDAHGRHADRGPARARRSSRSRGPRASARPPASGWCGPATSGEKVGPPSTEREDMRLLFDAVAAGLDVSQAPEPGTIQWDFPDAEPWHVVVANGSTRAEPGRAPAAHRDAAHPLRGLRGRDLRPRGPAPPGGARAHAPEGRRALALARAPDVPLVGA